MTTAEAKPRRRRADPDKVSKLPKAVCGGCSATWQSLALAHCSVCHHSFGSVDLFDRHRDSRGERGTCVLPKRNGITLVDGVWREAPKVWP